MMDKDTAVSPETQISDMVHSILNESKQARRHQDLPGLIAQAQSESRRLDAEMEALVSAGIRQLGEMANAISNHDGKSNTSIIQPRQDANSDQPSPEASARLFDLEKENAVLRGQVAKLEYDNNVLQEELLRPSNATHLVDDGV